MKVSLLIANYNNGKYFQDCYNSIIAQTYGNWEAVIIDDKSTDDSVEVIKKIIGSDERFRLMELPENKGVGYVKNLLATEARGVFCAYLDPDDAIAENALERCLQAFTNENIIAAYSKITFCDSDLKPMYDFKQIRQIYNDPYFFNLPTQINALFVFRKSAFDKTSGIDTSLSSAVDQDLYLKLLEHGDAKFIPEGLYLYRRHEKGISQSSSKNKAKENFGKVIFAAMKRRNLKTINGVPVPDEYPGSAKIFEMLDYQNKIPYRIKKKVKIFWQKITG
ncbi:glycosyltransferase family 2 protein [Cruoricaptor ignavus]|uniref:glycosyltransferase family 2 protein n=1 Tax=Cruoricaptor ignavus TaxID=1118202 RepID=UPI00370D64B5